MNTTRTPSYTALAAAAFMTLAMLLGVNTLAEKDTPALQMAQARSAQA